MEQLVNPKGQVKITDLVKELNSSLITIQPNCSETTKIITYALLATAVVGIMVYQYIRDSERSPDSFLKKGLEREADLKQNI